MTSEAGKRGEDVTQQGYRLNSINQLFQEADYIIARSELDRLVQKWPEMYGASEAWIIIFIGLFLYGALKIRDKPLP
jgi:hypothetical protein